MASQTLRTLACLAIVAVATAPGSRVAQAQGAAEPPKAAAPGTPVKLAADIHETIERVPVTVRLIDGRSHTGTMVVTHFRPDGAGPFPVVVLNHGRASDERAKVPRWRYTPIAHYWTRRGFAVFVPTRLGYGDSGVEPDPELSGACARKNYGSMLQAATAAVSATLDLAKRQPWADTRRVIVMGISVGGITTTYAVGRGLPGIIAGINVAGGAGGNPRTMSAHPCDPGALKAVYAAAGRTAKAKMLWLYAQNDKYWGAELPRQWAAAYSGAGGKVDFEMLPPVGDDGHRLIASFSLWRPRIDRFLAGLGFAAPVSAGAPAATTFAPLEDAGRIPFIRDTGREAYAKFLAADVPRAFALSRDGAWAFQSGHDAMQRAVERCQKHTDLPCRLYAVDDAVVWAPQD